MKENDVEDIRLVNGENLLNFEITDSSNPEYFIGKVKKFNKEVEILVYKINIIYREKKKGTF